MPEQAADSTRPVSTTEYGCEFKVVVTNQRMSPRKVVAFGAIGYQVTNSSEGSSALVFSPRATKNLSSRERSVLQ